MMIYELGGFTCTLAVLDSLTTGMDSSSKQSACCERG